MKNFKFIKNLISIPFLILLTACMSGTMHGSITGGKPVVVNYKQAMSHDIYSTVIDDEYFEGKAVMLKSSMNFYSAFGYRSHGSVYTGQVKAVLIGRKGSSLACLMNYVNPEGFTSAGGAGECFHSDGRIIRLMW